MTIMMTTTKRTVRIPITGGRLKSSFSSKPSPIILSVAVLFVVVPAWVVILSLGGVVVSASVVEVSGGVVDVALPSSGLSGDGEVEGPSSVLVVMVVVTLSGGAMVLSSGGVVGVALPATSSGEVEGPSSVLVVVVVTLSGGTRESTGGVMVSSGGVEAAGGTTVLSSPGVLLLGGITSGISRVAGGGELTTGHSHVRCPVAAADMNRGSKKSLPVAGDSTTGWSHPSTKLARIKEEFRKSYTVNPRDPNAGSTHDSLHT